MWSHIRSRNPCFTSLFSVASQKGFHCIMLYLCHAIDNDFYSVTDVQQMMVMLQKEHKAELEKLKVVIIPDILTNS